MRRFLKVRSSAERSAQTLRSARRALPPAQDHPRGPLPTADGALFRLPPRAPFFSHRVLYPRQGRRRSFSREDAFLSVVYHTPHPISSKSRTSLLKKTPNTNCPRKYPALYDPNGIFCANAIRYGRRLSRPHAPAPPPRAALASVPRAQLWLPHGCPALARRRSQRFFFAPARPCGRRRRSARQKRREKTIFYR